MKSFKIFNIIKMELQTILNLINQRKLIELSGKKEIISSSLPSQENNYKK